MSILAVKNVSVQFGGLQALKDVSFEVQPGEILGLIGPNGAGKSTLFEIISGFRKPTSGDVLFKGKSLHGKKPPEINRLGVGRTFQIMRLFLDMSALENVLVGGLVSTGSVHKARERAETMLELVGLGAKRDFLANELSTGQRKRLEMARAMATNPELLLLDEVFGGVDAQASEELAECVLDLNRNGQAMVVIDHNLELLVRLVNRIVCLHLGEVIAQGLPADVATEEAVVEAYLR